MVSVLGMPMLILMAALWVIPFWMLLPKFGLSKWISLISIVPLLGILLLWLIAFRRPVHAEINPEVFE